MSAQKGQNIFEVALKFDPSHIGVIEILKELLISAGIEENNIVACHQWPDTCLNVYFYSRAKARSLQKRLRAYRLKQVLITVKHLHKKDWQTKWKNGFKPFTLTQTFGVIPQRLKKKYHFRDRVPIYIDTDLAFGTGLHATTRFMAQLVERCQGRFQSFLDVGTGTGILSVIAFKCGADNITAIDINPEAVKVARSNFINNDCSSIHVRAVDAQKVRIKRRYDFVCANIITQDLINMAEKLISLVKPGKYLAVSGISLNSYDMFRQAYAQYPLRCLKIERGEGWAAILYKKL